MNDSLGLPCEPRADILPRLLLLLLGILVLASCQPRGDEIGPCGYVEASPPQDAQVLIGEKASFQVGLTLSDAIRPTFQWRRSDDGGRTWTDIAGANQIVYEIGHTELRDNGAMFQVFVDFCGATPTSDGQRTYGPATLTVLTAPLPSFDLVVAPSSLSVQQGSVQNASVAVVRNAGFDNVPVSFSASGAQPGISLTFSPNPAGGDASTVSVAAELTTPVGTYTVDIVGRGTPSTGTDVVRTASLTVAVTAAGTNPPPPPPPTADFSISLNPASIAIEQTAIAAVDVAINRSFGFSDPVSFAVSGVPPGAFARFDPPTPTSGNLKRLVLTAQSTASPGTATITVTATGGGLSRTATLTVDITPGVQYCPYGALADSFVSPPITDGSPGVSQVLRVSSSTLQQAAKPYLAFDVNGIAPSFFKVELVMNLFANPGAVVSNSTRTVWVRGITDNADWYPSSISELAINWNNAPKNDTTQAYGFVGEGANSSDPSRVLGTIVVFHTHAPGAHYRVDVTDYVRWALGLNPGYSSFAGRDADGILTVMMSNNMIYAVGANDYTEFRSRDAAAECERPHLEVYQ